MEVINEVWPTDPERARAMLEDAPDGPIYMINLLKFKQKAEYEDGRETDVSGDEAYKIYSAGVEKLLPEFGGRHVFGAEVSFLALGQVEDLWDVVAIAMYPSRGDMARMSMSNEWQLLAIHRTAGLAGQLNIETVSPTGVLAGSTQSAG